MPKAIYSAELKLEIVEKYLKEKVSMNTIKTPNVNIHIKASYVTILSPPFEGATAYPLWQFLCHIIPIFYISTKNYTISVFTFEYHLA